MRTKNKGKQQAAKSKPKAMIKEIDVNMDSEQRKSYQYMQTIIRNYKEYIAFIFSMYFVFIDLY
jgi:hypothetical protein